MKLLIEYSLLQNFAKPLFNPVFRNFTLHIYAF